MSVSALLAQGRAAAEQLMVDACLIRRKVGEFTNEETGDVTPTYEVIYEGKCRVQQSAQGASARSQDAGEAHVLMLALVLQLPMSVVGAQPEDEAKMTASEHDPDLPGRVFLLRALAHKTHATSRRFGIEERTS